MRKVRRGDAEMSRSSFLQCRQPESTVARRHALTTPTHLDDVAVSRPGFVYLPGASESLRQDCHRLLRSLKVSLRFHSRLQARHGLTCATRLQQRKAQGKQGLAIIRPGVHAALQLVQCSRRLAAAQLTHAEPVPRMQRDLCVRQA
jgi:hypothetical protein